jgi:AcrR family transcriptional regulator
MEEATGQFFKYGIRNVTMDEIAASLGISKRTVYEAFKDKTELVQTCIKGLSRLQDQKNQEIILGSANVIEAIFLFMQEGIKAMNSINPVFFTDIRKYYPGIWKPLHDENREKAHRITHTLLRKGLNEGLFRKDIHVGIVSKLFHEQMNLLADEKIFPRDEYTPSEVFKNLVISFTRGISTNKGIEIIDRILG